MIKLVMIMVVTILIYNDANIMPVEAQTETIDTKIILEKQTYALREPINFTIHAKNLAAFPQRIVVYPIPDFTILNATNRERIYRHHDVFTPPPVLYPIELQPQEEYTYGLSWNQKNYKGEPVNAGEYILSVHAGFGPGDHGTLTNNTVIKISDKDISTDSKTPDVFEKIQTQSTDMASVYVMMIIITILVLLVVFILKWKKLI